MTFVDLRRNFGQTTALQAGFDHAGGEVIIAMDGDLQHDPYEIPLFIRKIDEGYDIASGWRVRRGDNFIMRRLPSRIANRLLAKVSGVDLHDFGTTYKAYRREMLDDVRLYGDMHRFVPAICARLGARSPRCRSRTSAAPAERAITASARTFRVALDIITVRFISKYMTAPLHFFGKWALVCGLTGIGILGYGAWRKIDAFFEGRRKYHWFSGPENHGPMIVLGIMLCVLTTVFLSTGLIGELLMRIYFEASPRENVRGAQVDKKEMTNDAMTNVQSMPECPINE